MTVYGAKELTVPEPSFYVRKDGAVENDKGVDVYNGTVQDAMEWAQSKCPVGGLVKLDAGDFPITRQTRCYRSTLGVAGRTRLYPGASLTQTMIALATSSPSATDQLQGIVFGDMIIDGLVSRYPVSVDRSNIYSRKNFYGGVQLRHCRNVLIRNLTIKDIPASHGIQLQASMLNTIRGCSIDTVGSESIFGAYGNGICSGEMYAGISASYNLLEDCTIRNCSMVQVNWEPGDHNMARRVKMYGTRSGKFWDLDNKWKYCRAITVWQKGGFPASSSNKFEDCYYEGLGLAVSINGADTDLLGCEIVTTGTNGEDYCQVLYNGAKNASGKVKGCTFRPIKGQAAVKLADVKGMDIEGNDLLGSGGVGISGTASNSVIVGNKCVGFTSPVNVVGSGNTIDGNGPSVVLQTGAAAKPPTASAPNGCTVTKDGDIYVAKDRAGSVLTSGQDAAVVINAALNAITSGRTSKEKVKVETSAILSKRIEMPSYAVLECADGVVFTGAGNNQLVGSNGTHDWEIIGGEWVCTYKEAKSSASPMVFSAPKSCLVRDAKVRDSLWNNIIVDNADGMTIRNVESYHSWAVDPKNINATGWSGIIFLLNADNCVVEDCYLHDCGHGGCYFYSNEEGQPGKMNNNIMRNNRVERCGTSGLSISQRSTAAEGDNNIIDGNTIIDCGMDGNHPHINIGFYTSPNPPARNNIVRNNTIIDTKEYADQGIIDQGQGTEIYGNDIQGVRAPIVLLRAVGSNVHDNNIHGSSGTAIMGSATNATIRDNVITGTKGTVNVTGTGNIIENNGPSVVIEEPEPAKGGGINDASILGNLVRGGAVKWYNKAFGSSGNANEGSETELVPPDGREWTYACIYMSNLKMQGYEYLRLGFHDWQTTRAGMDAGAVVVADKARLLLDAAEIYGIGVVLVIGGLSDKSTAEQGFGLFDCESSLYKAFVRYAAAIADELYGSKLRLLELINEADFITCVEKYWKRKSIADFNAWSSQLVADVKAAQKRPGVPIGMGTAVDSTIHAMNWLSEISGDTKAIDSMVGMCDVISVHSYIGEKGSTPFNVWKDQKVPAFVAAAKRCGKELVFGETGCLYEGGTYDADMDKVLKASGSTYLWMVRRHDPKVYTIPTVPERPTSSTHTPAPETPPVVDEPTTPVVIEPPAQETPETPAEAGGNESGTEEPAPNEGPAVPSEGTGQEPSPGEEVEGPPMVVEEPPSVEPVKPTPGGPAVETPTDSTSSPGPTPGTGRNVLLELVKWLLRLFKRW